MNGQPKKYAIYTAMVGGYDKIMQPMVVDNRYDYILFSNDIKEDRVGVWQVKKIFYNNEIQTKIARYVKTHPDELLPEYEFTVWVDSNIIISSNFLYERALQLYQNKVSIATMNHLERNCIYDEAFVLLEGLIEYESIILDWGRVLRKTKYPSNNGLFETNVLFRVNNEVNIHINMLWWSYIEKYSKRDQLSFNYVLWLLQEKCDYILPIDRNTNNSIDFVRVSHKNDINRGVDYKGNIPWLLRYVYKLPNHKNEIKKIYYHIYKMPFPYFFAFLFGQYFRFKYLVNNYQRFYIKKSNL